MRTHPEVPLDCPPHHRRSVLRCLVQLEPLFIPTDSPPPSPRSTIRTLPRPGGFVCTDG